VGRGGRARRRRQANRRFTAARKLSGRGSLGTRPPNGALSGRGRGRVRPTSPDAGAVAIRAHFSSTLHPSPENGSLPRASVRLRVWEASRPHPTQRSASRRCADSLPIAASCSCSPSPQAVTLDNTDAVCGPVTNARLRVPCTLTQATLEADIAGEGAPDGPMATPAA
jgi:hypothetical protein